MVYRANELGTGSQVYVRPYPDVTGGSQHLIGRGDEPIWGPDGREFFYRGPDGVMAVSVEADPADSMQPNIGHIYAEQRLWRTIQLRSDRPLDWTCLPMTDASSL